MDIPCGMCHRHLYSCEKQISAYSNVGVPCQLLLVFYHLLASGNLGIYHIGALLCAVSMVT